MDARAQAQAARSRRWRLRLAGLRLAILYVLLWALLVAGGLTGRTLLEADWGLEPAGQAAPRLSLAGINVELMSQTAAEQDVQLLELRKAGFAWVRQRFAWDVLEPQTADYRWDAADGFFAAAAAADVEVVAVLDGSPAWARAPRDRVPVDNVLAPPLDPATFAQFAAQFAARYGEHLRYYQIWDEPNIAPHWGDRHIDPVAYAQLLKLTAAAIRTVDPDAVIVAGALAPTQDRGHTAVDEVYFLQRMYAAGAAPAFDVVAVQPFGFGYAPTDPAQRRAVLNLARLGWIRRGVEAAGDAATPIWAVRYGWNRVPNPQWGTVTSPAQVAYAGEATEQMQERWPWLTAAAWAVARPAAPQTDPRWGFALTPPLANAIVTLAGNATTARTAPQQLPFLTLIVLGGAFVAAGWRGVAAWRLLPWRSWTAALQRQPVAVLCGGWAGVAVLYFFVAWPPFIVLCWLAALLLTWSRPRYALALALALAPFFFQHKEVALVNRTLTIPPAYVPLFALVPVLMHERYRGRVRWPSELLDWLALAWLGVNVAAAWHVWQRAAYMRGFVDFAIAPVLLYVAIRRLVTTPAEWRAAVGALFAGGAVAALMGSIGWLQGEGTEADGVRRLVGPYFSANHMALYLERSLFVGVGLWSGTRGGWRFLIALGIGPVMAALVLTASRGALLMGIPAGVLVLLLMLPGQRIMLRRVMGWAAGAALLLAITVTTGAGVDRLANLTTLEDRFAIWRSTLALWRDFPVVGVGPGGFFWRYPAYIPPGAAIDPNLQHPHNVWLETASGWGLIGLIWLVVISVWVIRTLLQLRDPRAQNAGTERSLASCQAMLAGLVAGLTAGFAHGQVDAFGSLPDLAAWNWAAVGLIAAYSVTASRKETAPARDGLTNS